MPDEVGEEDGDEAPLRHGRGRRRRRRGGGRSALDERGAALSAELDRRRIGGAASRARARERRAAFPAELPIRLVLGPTGGARHRVGPVFTLVSRPASLNRGAATLSSWRFWTPPALGTSCLPTARGGCAGPPSCSARGLC